MHQWLAYGVGVVANGRDPVMPLDHGNCSGRCICLHSHDMIARRLPSPNAKPDTWRTVARSYAESKRKLQKAGILTLKPEVSHRIESISVGYYVHKNKEIPSDVPLWKRPVYMNIVRGRVRDSIVANEVPSQLENPLFDWNETFGKIKLWPKPSRGSCFPVPSNLLQQLHEARVKKARAALRRSATAKAHMQTLPILAARNGATPNALVKKSAWWAKFPSYNRETARPVVISHRRFPPSRHYMVRPSVLRRKQSLHISALPRSKENLVAQVSSSGVHRCRPEDSRSLSRRNAAAENASSSTSKSTVTGRGWRPLFNKSRSECARTLPFQRRYFELLIYVARYIEERRARALEKTRLRDQIVIQQRRQAICRAFEQKEASTRALPRGPRSLGLREAAPKPPTSSAAAVFVDPRAVPSASTSKSTPTSASPSTSSSTSASTSTATFIPPATPAATVRKLPFNISDIDTRSPNPYGHLSPEKRRILAEMLSVPIPATHSDDPIWKLKTNFAPEARSRIDKSFEEKIRKETEALVAEKKRREREDSARRKKEAELKKKAARSQSSSMTTPTISPLVTSSQSTSRVVGPVKIKPPPPLRSLKLLHAKSAKTPVATPRPTKLVWIDDANSMRIYVRQFQHSGLSNQRFRVEFIADGHVIGEHLHHDELSTKQQEDLLGLMATHFYSANLVLTKPSTRDEAAMKCWISDICASAWYHFKIDPDVRAILAGGLDDEDYLNGREMQEILLNAAAANRPSGEIRASESVQTRTKSSDSQDLYAAAMLQDFAGSSPSPAVISTSATDSSLSAVLAPAVLLVNVQPVPIANKENVLVADSSAEAAPTAHGPEGLSIDDTPAYSAPLPANSISDQSGASSYSTNDLSSPISAAETSATSFVEPTPEATDEAEKTTDLPRAFEPIVYVNVAHPEFLQNAVDTPSATLVIDPSTSATAIYPPITTAPIVDHLLVRSEDVERESTPVPITVLHQNDVTAIPWTSEANLVHIAPISTTSEVFTIPDQVTSEPMECIASLPAVAEAIPIVPVIAMVKDTTTIIVQDLPSDAPLTVDDTYYPSSAINSTLVEGFKVDFIPTTGASILDLATAAIDDDMSIDTTPVWNRTQDDVLVEDLHSTTELPVAVASTPAPVPVEPTSAAEKLDQAVTTTPVSDGILTRDVSAEDEILVTEPTISVATMPAVMPVPVEEPNSLDLDLVDGVATTPLLDVEVEEELLATEPPTTVASTSATVSVPVEPTTPTTHDAPSTVSPNTSQPLSKERLEAMAASATLARQARQLKKDRRLEALRKRKETMEMRKRENVNKKGDNEERKEGGTVGKQEEKRATKRRRSKTLSDDVHVVDEAPPKRKETFVEMAVKNGRAEALDETVHSLEEEYLREPASEVVEPQQPAVVMEADILDKPDDNLEDSMPGSVEGVADHPREMPVDSLLEEAAEVLETVDSRQEEGVDLVAAPFLLDEEYSSDLLIGEDKRSQMDTGRLDDVVEAAPKAKRGRGRPRKTAKAARATPTSTRSRRSRVTTKAVVEEQSSVVASEVDSPIPATKMKRSGRGGRVGKNTRASEEIDEDKQSSNAAEADRLFQSIVSMHPMIDSMSRQEAVPLTAPPGCNIASGLFAPPRRSPTKMELPEMPPTPYPDKKTRLLSRRERTAATLIDEQQQSAQSLPAPLHSQSIISAAHVKKEPSKLQPSPPPTPLPALSLVIPPEEKAVVSHTATASASSYDSDRLVIDVPPETDSPSAILARRPAEILAQCQAGPSSTSRANDSDVTAKVLKILADASSTSSDSRSDVLWTPCTSRGEKTDDITFLGRKKRRRPAENASPSVSKIQLKKRLMRQPDDVQVLEPKRPHEDTEVQCVDAQSDCFSYSTSIYLEHLPLTRYSDVPASRLPQPGDIVMPDLRAQPLYEIFTMYQGAAENVHRMHPQSSSNTPALISRLDYSWADKVNQNEIPFAPSNADVDASMFSVLVTTLLYSYDEAFTVQLPTYKDRYASLPEHFMNIFRDFQPDIINSDDTEIEAVSRDITNGLSKEASKILTKSSSQTDTQLVTRNSLDHLLKLATERSSLLWDMLEHAVAALDVSNHEMVAAKYQWEECSLLLLFHVSGSLVRLAAATGISGNSIDDQELINRFATLVFGWQSFLMQGGALRLFLLLDEGRSHPAFPAAARRWLAQCDEILADVRPLLCLSPLERVRAFFADELSQPDFDEMINSSSDSRTDQFNFACRRCKVFFASEKALEAHKAIHAVEGAHACKCGLDFKYRPSLCLHIIHRHVVDLPTFADTKIPQ